MSERKPILFSCDEDAETLTDAEPDEAIRSYLDQMLTPSMTPAEVLATVPKTLTLYGYARTVLPASVPDPEEVLDQIMERVEEDEYGDPDGADWHERMKAEAVAAVRAKAIELCAAIREHYVPWYCERVTKEEVNVEAWIREHEPEWLEQPSEAK